MKNSIDMLEELQKMLANPARANEPLSRHTSLRVGGPARYFAELVSLEELRRVTEYSREKGLKFFILGEGTNVLFPDYGFDGIVVRLVGDFAEFCIKGQEVIAGAGVKLSLLVNETANNGLSGLEFACGIPGSLGGAIVINAGTKMGSIGDAVAEVKILQEGKLMILERDELIFSYRYSNLPPEGVVIGAKLRLRGEEKDKVFKRIQENMEQRRKTQPLSTLNAGCVFKNPPGSEAGRLIENCGLKRARVGGAEVSEKHANFIINCGNATAQDVYTLIQKVRDAVREKFGIELELELKLVGWREN